MGRVRVKIIFILNYLVFNIISYFVSTLKVILFYRFFFVVVIFILSYSVVIVIVLFLFYFSSFDWVLAQAQYYPF